MYKRQAKHSEWPSYVRKVEDWLNSTTHESTGYTPHELVKGTRPPRILEQLFDYPEESERTDVSIKIRLANENLLNKGDSRKHRHDTRGKWVKYEIGQLVLVRRHDLSSAQEKEIKMENAYVLQDMDTGKVIGTHNATNLKRYRFKTILVFLEIK